MKRTRCVSEGERSATPRSRSLWKRSPSLTLRVSFLLLVIAGVAAAQRGPFMRREFRPEIVDRGGIPDWKNDERFKSDVFTFVRVRYSSAGGYGRHGGNWHTDYPDAELNFSYRLREMTALDVDPNGKVLELTDEALLDYPWAYLIEPGRMALTDAEVAGLRRYLLNGGFLMVDDFWGELEWANFYQEIKRVFPDREPIELPLEHEIFHIVYDLKKKPQVPNIHAWLQTGRSDDNRPDASEVHYKALFDDKGRRSESTRLNSSHQ